MSRTVLFIARRQLWARKGLNSIAVLGVTIGVLVLIAISAILQGFQQKFLANITRISPHVTVFDKELRHAAPLLARFRDDHVVASVSHEVPSDRQLRISRPHEATRALEQMPGVLAAACSINGSAVVAFGPKQYPIDLRGIDSAAQDRVTPISSYVSQGGYRGLGSGSKSVILGSGVASSIGAKLGDAVRIGSPLGQTQTLKVVGLFDVGIPTVDNSRVYVALRDGQAILGRPDVVSRVELRLQDPDTSPVVSEQLESMFGYDCESWQEQNASFLALFAQQNMIIKFVVGAILSLGGFGILAAQIMIVLQKTRDIAIMRSLGFRRSDMLQVFLLQGAAIAVTGGLLGDVTGHYLVAFLGTLKNKGEGFVKSENFLVYDDPKSYVYGAAFALGIGLIASVIPAWRASRVEPVDVLRGQV